MKKHFKYLTILAVGASTLAACKKSFLTTAPIGTNLESQYYRNQTEAFNGLVAVYDVVGFQGSDLITKENAMDAACDDHYAGGASAGDLKQLQDINTYNLTANTGPSGDLWGAAYQGIFRANVLLEKLPDVPMDASTKSRYASEAKGLRAYFYLDLVRLFKNIPLITAQVPTDQIYNQVQVPPAQVYAQIEKDLNEAIADPNVPNTVDTSTEGGRLTKQALYALLGKTLLYEKKWADAAKAFAEVNGTDLVNGNSKYANKLMANFADLWSVNHKFNSESILEVGHSSKSGGDWSCAACSEGNFLNIMVGPRAYQPLKPGAPDYVSGYSALVVTKDFFDAIHYDPRNAASVANLDSLKKNGIADYSETAGYMNTGYFLGKFIGHVADRTTGGGNPDLNYPQNIYEIRLADTYLMEAEALIMSNGNLTRAAALMTAVHTRAYNDGKSHPLAATMDVLKKERRLELFGEGHRWFDLVRWGDAPTVLASKGFKAGRNEILPIPEGDLNGTKLQQSKEYGGTL